MERMNEALEAKKERKSTHSDENFDPENFPGLPPDIGEKSPETPVSSALIKTITRTMTPIRAKIFNPNAINLHSKLDELAEISEGSTSELATESDLK